MVQLIKKSCTSSNPTSNTPTHLPPPAKPVNNSANSAVKLSRSNNKSDLPKAEDFYAIYQQYKRKTSVSPLIPASTTSSNKSGSGGSSRESSATPTSPQSVSPQFQRPKLSRRSSCKASIGAGSGAVTAAAALFNKAAGGIGANLGSNFRRSASVRHRSPSPKTRSKVEFWEERSESDILSGRTARSRERECVDSSDQTDGTMSAKADIQIKGGGIMERLAQLKKHGDEDWRKRVQKPKESSELISRSLSSGENEHKEKKLSPVLMRRNQNGNGVTNGGAAALRPVSMVAGGGALSGSAAANRPTSLMDRMSKLNQAQQQWQNKVEEKDAKKFTVEGKMERDRFIKSVMTDTTSVAESAKESSRVKPSLEPAVTGRISRTIEPSTKNANTTEPQFNTPSRKPSDRTAGVRHTPKMTKFQGSNTPSRTRPVSLFCHSDNAPTDAANVSAAVSNNVRRSNSMRKLEGGSGVGSLQDRISSVLNTPPSPTRTPPSNTPEMIPEESIDCDLEAPSNYKPSLNNRKSVQPHKRRARGSKNPVKSLLARKDLVIREEDLKSSEDKENRNKDKNSKHSHLAAEARAGLASTEDFTSVQLRKEKLVVNQRMQPYNNRMLIQVKGRRFCQCRLVEPVAASVNSGDSYVFLTDTELFNWQGKFSNVIERARSAEVALTILQKKELGCKKIEKVQTIDEEKLVQCSRENRKFWAALAPTEKDPQPMPAGPPQEDEDYEQSMVEASCVYEVNPETDELVPIADSWGLPPKFSLLEPKKVLVFDFGSEVYSYSGKSANFDDRKIGARLAQELWGAGWDYTSCLINPVFGVSKLMTADSRPDWTVVGRINSNMETVLFREKFIDWPDKTRVIGKSADGKEREDFDINTAPAWAWADLDGWTGKDIYDLERQEPNLQLEGSQLGRGREFYDLEERRQYIVETLGVKCWHVEENTSKSLPESFTGQFHAQDTYVIRWKYKVALTGRNLKGGASKYSAVGRERCCYFFWQGQDSKISLQGASALQTVELDSEKGPQLRVPEGSEHAAFLSLFNGHMVIYKGARGETNFKEWRMFLVRGQDKNETYLKEVDCTWQNLRSHAVIILVKRGKVYLWVGRHAECHQKEMGEQAGQRLASQLPKEMGLGDSATFSTVQSGSESQELLTALGGRREQISSLFDEDKSLRATPRLFHMSSVHCKFEVAEVISDQLKLDIPNPLLFSQNLLYSAEQPALFMFDCWDRIWLWQGWIQPDSQVGSEAVGAGTTTGSGEVRWHAERRAAMASALEYRRVVRRQEPERGEVELKLVWAGHEPQRFCNYFPEWTLDEDVKYFNMQSTDTRSFETIYYDLSRTEYTLEELQTRPLPHGVDPSRIEQYLADKTFKDKFKMSKDEYAAAPRWKQIEMKKEAGLF